MTYDARQVANWFVERARKDGKSLSIMSLLKLVYFAHGWNLAFNKAPLFSNRIEAWQYGPVVPDVYRDFRGQGVNVSKPLPSYLGSLSESTVGLLNEVYRVYGKLPAFQLSDLTHVRGGPWHVAWEIDGWYTPIPDDLIEQHFELQRLRLQEKKKAESLNA
jgi:uncharacterized phage-associated protein